MVSIMPAKMNNTIFIAEKNPRRSTTSGNNHVPLFIIRPMPSNKIKTILPPQHYKPHNPSVSGLPDYVVKDRDFVTLERLLPLLGIYPNKMLYKNPEYSTAPKVQHIFLPVPSKPVYYPPKHIEQVEFVPHPSRSHMHTSIIGSSHVGLQNVIPYNPNPPSIYHAPMKHQEIPIAHAVHLKHDPYLPTKDQFLPLQSHHSFDPHGEHHHFVPLPSYSGSFEHKSNHFFPEHSSEHFDFNSPPLGKDDGIENHINEIHSSPIVKIQSKKYTPPQGQQIQHIQQHFQQQPNPHSFQPTFGQPPFLYQNHYRVLPLKNKPEIRFRSESGSMNPLKTSPAPNRLLYPLPPPTTYTHGYGQMDPNVKPVIEQAVEESLRRQQTQSSDKEQSNNNSKMDTVEDDDQFKPIPPPTMPGTIPMTPSNTTTTSTTPTTPNAGNAYAMMGNKCEEKCNNETKTKDENSETVCGTNGTIYSTKTQFICAQKCGQKGNYS